MLCGAAAVGQQPSFKVSVGLVTIPVTVHSRDTNVRLPALSAADFRVFEDGEEQEAKLLHIDRRPLSLAIVLDVSRSMAGQRQELEAAALRTIFQVLGPEDEVSLTVFSEMSAVPVPWSRAGDLPGLEWEQWVMAPAETPLRDAVQSAVELMDSASHARHVVAVISDGLEESSSMSWPALVQSRRQSETEVYAFRIAPWRERLRPRSNAAFDGGTTAPPIDVMSAIVGDSGGSGYLIESPASIVQSAMSFARDLQNQYLLGYEPRRPLDGKYRRIKVEANRDLRVRHRGGYLALPVLPNDR